MKEEKKKLPQKESKKKTKETRKKEEVSVKKVSKKDISEILVIVLFCLLGLEIILIPCLIYAEVKRLLPIIFFLILPTIFGIIVILLSRNCSNDYEHKKERLMKKL